MEQEGSQIHADLAVNRSARESKEGQKQELVGRHQTASSLKRHSKINRLIECQCFSDSCSDIDSSLSRNHVTK